MLHRTMLFSRVTRSWTKKSVASASAHFPDAVRSSDPASMRSSSTSAKERRVWVLREEMQGRGPSVPKPLLAITRRLRLYGDLVRFDRPVGWLLLMIPCYWGSALAVTKALVWEGADPVVLCAPFIPLHLAIHFLAGAYLMRSVGCIVNDMWDRKFDRMVERTRDRPLASGAVNTVEACGVLMVHLTLAGFVAFNLSPAALYASLAITPVWIIYPFMKRVTFAPQVFLGLCFNWGIFVGYAAVLGRVDLPVCLPIYFASVIWTVLYDTIYAYQDRDDDTRCGVKSTAIWIGDRKYILNAMIAPIALGMLVSGLMVSQSLPYYAGILLCAYRLHCIVDDVNIYDRWSCAEGFKRNVRLGLYVFASMCFGNVFWALAAEHQEGDTDAEHNSTSADSALMRFMLCDQKPIARGLDVEGFSWVDRLVHPVFVQAESAKATGKTEAPPIPAWMRREYLGDNMGTVLSLSGVPAETVVSWQHWWYALLDHYNMFPKMQL